MDKESGVRILVVGNEAPVAELLTEILEASDYTVIGTALDGREALEMTPRLEPNVILLDLDLPDMDGLEVARLISARHPVPIVGLTSDDRPELEETATLSGIGAALPKPPNGEALDRAIAVARARFPDLLELRRLNERLASKVNERDIIIQTTADGFWMMDVRGQFVEANQASADMLGYSREEMLGLRIDDVEDFESRKEILRHIQNVRQTGADRFETRHRRKDGGIIDVEVSTNYLSEQDAFIVFSRDITERKRAEEALKKSERTFRAAFETSPDSININRAADGVYIDVNDSFLRIMGYDKEEVLGISSKDLSIWADPTNRARLVAELEEHGFVENLEALFNRKDGSTRYGLMSARLFDLDGEPCILSITRDITDRKEAEEELRKSEKKYHSLFEQSVEGIYLHDLDGRILDVNQVACKQSGYSREELLEMSVFDLHPPSSVSINLPREKILAQWRSRSIEDRATIEAEHQRKDGSLYSVQVSTGIIRYGDKNLVLAIVQDITERKRSQEALTMSEARYRSLFESSPEPIMVLSFDGTILDHNHDESPLGLRREEMLGKKLFDLEVRGIAQLTELFDRVKEGDPRPIEVELGTKAGSRVWLEVHPAVADEAAERTIRLSLLDITERKQAEMEKALLQTQLQQAMKMEAVGRLAGGVAHDFNNLLLGITGNVEFALMDLEAGDPLEESLVEIGKAADRAANLTKQLLAFSRKQLIEPKVLSLNELISSMHRMLVRLIGEDIELETRPGRHLGAVKVDPGQFEQILVNLVINARDAMPDGGKLTIETANVSLDEEFRRGHPHTRPGPHVLLTVSDTGLGMNEETKRHLFEPFFTTKAKGHGTGLGLATIYGAVQQADGTIEVSSQEGAGTTFRISLPAVAEKAERLARDSRGSEMPCGSETILVVEDEKSVRDMAVKILKRLGYTVLQAPDGGQAFMLAEQCQEPIHLLMTDVVMPGMNGRQLADRLAKLHSELKVLFTSGYAEDTIAHHGILDEGLNFIGKPYTPQELAKKLRRVLDEPQ